MEAMDGEVRKRGWKLVGECVDVAAPEPGEGIRTQDSGLPAVRGMGQPATVLAGSDAADIGQFRDLMVGETNQRKARYWLELGRMLDEARKTAQEKYGYEGDFFAYMAQSRECLHKATELRNYHRCHLLWTGQLRGKTDGLENLSLTHLIQILPGKYSAEDKELHLRHAAKTNLSVSEFKVYLKERDTLNPDTVQGGSVDGTTKDSQSTSTDCSRDRARLISSLNRAFEQLVGFATKPGAGDIPEAILAPILHIIRIAVAKGLVPREDLRRVLDSATVEASDDGDDPGPDKGSHSGPAGETGHDTSSEDSDQEAGVAPSVVATDTLTYLDGFSGLGAFGMAAHSLGMTCVGAVDMDADCRAVYLANTGILPAGDITVVDARNLPPFDCLFAGFPCPAWSINGKHGGFSDPRGRLFFEVTRIADHHHPKFILLENVPHLLKHDNGNSFRLIARELDRIGYSIHHAVLNPGDFGIPVARERLYIVGFRRDIGGTGFSFPAPTNRLSDISGMLLPDEETTPFVIPSRPDLVLLPDAEDPPMELRGRQPIRIGHIRGGRHTGDVIYSPLGHACTFVAAGGKTGLYLVNGRVRKLHPRECARILGFPDSFRIMGCDSVALQQFGNTAVVPLLRLIMVQMLRTLGTGTPAARRIAA